MCNCSMNNCGCTQCKCSCNKTCNTCSQINKKASSSEHRAIRSGYASTMEQEQEMANTDVLKRPKKID